MAFVRRRYYFWLLKAYVKRLKKTIIFSSIVGVLLFFVILFLFKFQVEPLLDKKVTKIGFVGNYTLKNLPEPIMSTVSYGLMKINDSAEAVPEAAESYEKSSDGKQYTFHLKKNLRFHNGQQFTADTLPYNFEDVKKSKVDTYTVKFTLKSPYAPFLGSVSKPIVINQLQGLGKYKIKSSEVNGEYLKSITIENYADQSERKIYYFYPTDQALLTAFLLGDIDEVLGSSIIKFDTFDFSKLKNVKIEKKTNYDTLVTIFYNIKTKGLENKKVRQALQYALVNPFEDGERADSPIQPKSMFYSKPPNADIYDVDIAKSFLSSAGEDASSLKFDLVTSSDLKHVGDSIAKQWEKIGVKTSIKTTSDIPSDFQIFLYQFKVPKDPDQYSIWHSGQKNNITGYKSDRIDKLLENGRLTSNSNDRIKIYADFQKYLIDDAPATFLYFPYSYNIKRL